MTSEEMGTKAKELMKKKFHCSQAVLAAGQEKLGISSPEVVKAVGLYGGGISGTGEVCGALLGGIALISSLYSRANLEDKESPKMWKLGHMLDKRFSEITSQFGGKLCRDIARVDWGDRDQVNAFYKNQDSRHKYCYEVVEETARALCEILEKEVIGK
ncbi:MAG: C_GCAxxG_C_C family protein [Deltaproteobacteria bacterium]|nr:C_GCAxxG_C_C family protein [Deltaproteobacteria bacterium]